MARRRARGGDEGGGQNQNGSLSNLSVHDLQRELRRRESHLRRLHQRRVRLLDSLRAVDAEIAGLGGVAGGPGSEGVRRRARNDTNLVGALTQVLDGKTMSVTEVAQEVQRAGYVTTSPNFRTIVNQTLINSGKFKRVGRGLYTAKG